VRKLSSPDPIVEQLVMLYSKNFNVPPDQARAILQPILSKKDKLEEFKEFMAKVEGAKSILASLPKEIRDPMLFTLMRDIVSRSSSYNDDTLRTLIANELIKSIREDPKVEMLSKEVAELKAMLNKIIEETSKKTIYDELKKDIDELRKAVEELKKAPAQPQPQQPSLIDEIMKRIDERFKSVEDRVAKLSEQQQSLKASLAQSLKEFKETLEIAKEFGLIKEGGGQSQQSPQLSPDEMAEILKKYGWKVEKVTPEDLEKRLKEVEESIRARLEQEMGLDKARIESFTSIIRDIIRGVGEPMVRAFADVQKEQMRTMLALRLQQMMSQAQAQQQPRPSPPPQPVQQPQQQPSPPLSQPTSQEVTKPVEKRSQGGGGESSKPVEKSS